MIMMVHVKRCLNDYYLIGIKGRTASVREDVSCRPVIICMYVCMYVCMVITYSRLWVNTNPARCELDKKHDFFPVPDRA